MREASEIPRSILTQRVCLFMVSEGWVVAEAEAGGILVQASPLTGQLHSFH